MNPALSPKDAQAQSLRNSTEDLTVEVFSPRTPDPRKFTWSKSTLVGAAADEAARDFGYEAGTPTFQNKDKVVLDRQKTLFEVGVSDFDQLELVDTGGGV